MKIEMYLISDLCLDNFTDSKIFLIPGKDLWNSIHTQAKEIMNMFEKDTIEYLNYSEVYKELFEHKENNFKIFEGKLIDYNNKLEKLEKFHFINGKKVKTIKNNHKVCFDVDISLEKRYVNYLKLCILGTRYIGLFNNLGMGEVQLKLVV